MQQRDAWKHFASKYRIPRYTGRQAGNVMDGDDYITIMTPGLAREVALARSNYTI